jgi:hypothetical protein
MITSAGRKLLDKHTFGISCNTHTEVNTTMALVLLMERGNFISTRFGGGCGYEISPSSVLIGRDMCV